MSVNAHNMLPALKLNMAQMKELLAAEQPELNQVREHARHILLECSVNTSTEYLSRYEKIFGLQAGNKSVEERRAALILVLNSDLLITPAYMEQLLSSVLFCPVQIIEHFSEYTMTVDIEGGQHSPDFIEAGRYIYMLKPAHIYTTLHYRHMAHGGIYMAARPRIGCHVMVQPYQPENIEAEALITVGVLPRVGLRVTINPKGD